MDEVLKKHEKTRDSKGKWLKGKSGNPAGKPPGSISLVAMFRDALKEIDPKEKKSHAQMLIERWIRESKSGDLSMLKEAIRYTDGMPTQRIESENINIESKLPDEEEEQLRTAFEESTSKEDSSGE